MIGSLAGTAAQAQTVDPSELEDLRKVAAAEKDVKHRASFEFRIAKREEHQATMETRQGQLEELREVVAEEPELLSLQELNDSTCTDAKISGPQNKYSNQKGFAQMFLASC